MRNLLYFFALVLIVSCKEEPSDDFFFTKKNSDPATKNLVLNEVINDSNVYSENLSPDGSWEIFLNVDEGYFKGYTITYDSEKSITKKLNKEVNLSGEMDLSTPKWINNTTYLIPNIGGTSNGHFELIIYKDASCKYIEHFDALEEIEDEAEIGSETLIATTQPKEKKEPEITNSYSRTDNYIVFTQTIKNYGDPAIGCSSSESSLSIVIQNYTDSFEYHNEALSAIKLNYSYSGGLYDISGDKPFKGYLKGKLTPDKTWKIELDLWIATFSYVDNQKGKKQIKTSGVFKP